MTDQSKRTQRRWLYIPFLVAAAVMAAYYVLWSMGAQQMKNAVIEWAQEQRALGLTVTYAHILPDGFPFFLRVHIDDIEISSPDGWRWQGERLSLDALPYDLNKLIFSPKGAQTFSDDGLGEWRVTATDLRASIASDKAQGWIFSLTVGEASAYRDADGASASLQSLIVDLAPDAAIETTLAVNLAARQFTAELNSEQYTLAALQTMVSASQTHLLSGNDAIARWRHGGGEVVVAGLFADGEDVKLSISGAISLDTDDYPEGIVSTEIQNPAGLARLLGKVGALSSAEAETAAAGLSLMALAGGGKIAAPIDLKEGKARIAGVKIADLPRVQ